MTESYPNSAQNATAFFSPIPRAALALVQSQQISRRDLPLLTVLLDYKNVRDNWVEPKQKTLAARLCCSVDTVQRALARLVAAGLIVKRYIRDACGRLRGLCYDLTPTLSLLPTKAAKMRRGQFGRVDVQPEQTSPSPPSPKPQPCGVSEADKDCQANNRAARPAALPLPPVVVSLLRFGLQTHTALQLVAAHGEDKVQSVVQEAARKPRKTLCGWIVAALSGQWEFGRLNASGGAASVTDTELHALTLSSRSQIAAAARRYGWPRIGGEVFRRAERLPVLTDGQRETLAVVRSEMQRHG